MAQLHQVRAQDAGAGELLDVAPEAALTVSIREPVEGVADERGATPVPTKGSSRCPCGPSRNDDRYRRTRRVRGIAGLPRWSRRR